MALNKAGLEAELLKIFGKSNSAEAAASGIATAIDNYVKTATVTTQVALGIPVLAPPPSGVGATTGPGVGTGTLS